MWKAYQHNHHAVDFVVVCAVSAALIVVWELGLLGGKSAATSVILFATVAGLSGTLLGFAITSIAILIGLFQSPEFGPLRKGEDYAAIFSDYKLAIALLAATTLFSLGATIAAAAQIHSSIVLGITLALVAWSSITIAHAVDILWLAIRVHAKAEQDF